MRLIDWHYNQTTMRIREVATRGYTKLFSNEAWEVAAWEAMREAQKEKQWAEDETAKTRAVEVEDAPVPVDGDRDPRE